MITNFLQSRATGEGMLGNIWQNSALPFNNTELLEDAAAASGQFDRVKSEHEKNEDLALRYVREIKKLTRNKEAVKQLLFKEINRNKINKELTDKISNLIGTHMPLMIKAIKEKKHFKKMAVNFSLRKQFLEIIDSLEESTQKEAAFFFNRKVEQCLEKRNHDKYQVNIRDHFFRSINPQVNQKLLQIAPNIQRQIDVICILPFQAELQKCFQEEVDKKFKTRKKTDTFCKKINHIEMKMHKAFTSLTAHKSSAFQLLAYEYFYRKINQSKFRAFTKLTLSYSANPYKLSKFMRLSPMVFRVMG
ncbi:MAG: hypothetical protein HRT47_05055 [Candidatus Caenarcaniphilales bacterium]|nr:hypothetical protein [Candidatus Caenarcaniphilales bacterium]